ncbi:hypothetical protein TWF718_002897 [Orbilia javanica]|uniref:Short-chain dehydrogenase n=1 Tax=Orbilia javanica TaxID=47235 RepID=A0AAN8MP19_9PEZI
MSNTSWNDTTTSDEVAETLSSHINGKTILVTGVSPEGIGLEFCRAIASHSPALIILASRNPSKIAESQTYLSTHCPSVNVKPLVVDLSSLSSVRSAAAEINNSVEKVDVLVNNAGIHSQTLTRSKDGNEMTFATNHLGHFLFTNLLLKGAMKSGGRVVNLTSLSFIVGGVIWEDPNFLNTPFEDGWPAYIQSKTASVLFSTALAEKFGSRGVYSYSLHPGIIRTPMAYNLDLDSFATRSTATHVVAAFDPAIEPQNGGYLIDCQISPIMGKEAAWATGRENWERLWKLSEDLVGEEFS